MVKRHAGQDEQLRFNRYVALILTLPDEPSDIDMVAVFKVTDA